MSDDQIKIHSIGSLAVEILATQRVFKLFGETSKGYFLHSADNRIIFLTADPYRGPFTLNLSQPITCEVEPGQSVEIYSQKFHFPDCQVADFSEATKWCPDPFTPGTELVNPISEIIECSTFALSEGKHSLADLLPVFLKSNDQPLLTTEQEKVLNTLISFRKFSQNGEIANAVKTLLGIIGLGRGLTPSADDLISGMLLYWKRYSSSKRYGNIQHNLRDQMRSKQLKTTSISYQLLCAAHSGLADERIISAFDLLMNGSKDTVRIYQLLSSYGNSSGLDIFTGWVAAFLIDH